MLKAIASRATQMPKHTIGMAVRNVSKGTLFTGKTSPAFPI